MQGLVMVSFNCGYQLASVNTYFTYNKYQSAALLINEDLSANIDSFFQFHCMELEVTNLTSGKFTHQRAASCMCEELSGPALK